MSRIDEDPWAAGLAAGSPGILDLVTDGVLVVDEHDRLRAWNRPAAGWFDLSDDLAGAALDRVFDDDTVDGVLQLLRGGRRRPVTCQRVVDGLRVHLEVTGHQLQDGRAVLRVVDRSELVDIREHLGLLVDQLGSLQDLGQVGLWSWQPEADVVEWSSGMYRLHDIQAVDFQGTLEWMLAFVRPDHRDTVREMLQTVQADGTPTGVIVPVVRIDGQERWVEIRARRVGGEDRWTVVGVTQDVTEHQRNIRTLEQANSRLERVGSALAHDIQTPLVAVKGFAEVLRMTGGAGDSSEIIERIMANAQGAIDLTRSILATVKAGGTAVDPVRFSLRLTVEWVVDRLGDRVRQTGGQIRYYSPMPEVNTVEEVVRMVLVNLVANAVKYRSPDRDLLIQIRAEVVGDQVVVKVIDNGLGVAQEERERIFESGYRAATAEVIDGVGFGLGACRDALEDMGQEIWVDDGPEGGSAFSFTLPA